MPMPMLRAQCPTQSKSELLGALRKCEATQYRQRFWSGALGCQNQFCDIARALALIVTITPSGRFELGFCADLSVSK